jgi:hypothetical protein
MRYMIIVKNDPKTENTPPDPSMFEAMGKYNQSLADAGVLLAAEGLTASKNGALVTFAKGKVEVKDGPFSEAKELIGGFWILQVKSIDEALEWAKRIPFSHGETVEVRKVAESSDFEGVMPDDTLAQEKSLREQLARQNN